MIRTNVLYQPLCRCSTYAEQYKILLQIIKRKDHSTAENLTVSHFYFLYRLILYGLMAPNQATLRPSSPEFIFPTQVRISRQPHPNHFSLPKGYAKRSVASHVHQVVIQRRSTRNIPSLGKPPNRLSLVLQNSSFFVISIVKDSLVCPPSRSDCFLRRTNLV